MYCSYQRVCDRWWLATAPDTTAFSENRSHYVALINHKAAGRRCIVAFDGYASSSKDHEHKKKTMHGVGGLQIIITAEGKYPMSNDKFLRIEKNKESFIAYLDELISEYSETTVANDDSDTLISKKAIDLSAASSVELVAEDCDVVLLEQHSVRSSGDIFFTSQKGSFCIKDISANLAANERDRLLFLHTFSRCDTVNGIYRQIKVALVRKLCTENSELEKSSVE